MTAPAIAPIIIKRKKVFAAEGHHGGAWKVAYADFVTAMMAFFLLMWLLNATTEEQRAGLADYFDPAVPMSAVSGGGSGDAGGDSTYATDSLAHSGHGGSGNRMDEDGDLANLAAAALAEQAADGRVRVTRTPEGVVIDLIDTAGAPLFALGGAVPSNLLRDVVRAVVPVVTESGRDVKLVGHTDDLLFRPGATYTNWELSADRANTARRMAIKAGLDPAAIFAVSGRADRQPVSDDASAPENRRISIIMLNEAAVPSPAPTPASAETASTANVAENDASAPLTVDQP